MAASARMILMVDPGEKSRWAAEAGKDGISTAEFLRRAAARYDPLLAQGEEEIATVAISEINAALERMIVRLDGALATSQPMNDPVHEAEYRAKVMAELRANPPQLDLSRLRELAA